MGLPIEVGIIYSKTIALYSTMGSSGKRQEKSLEKKNLPRGISDGIPK